VRSMFGIAHSASPTVGRTTGVQFMTTESDVSSSATA
jgi:hypothetical protein